MECSPRRLRLMCSTWNPATHCQFQDVNGEPAGHNSQVTNDLAMKGKRQRSDGQEMEEDDSHGPTNATNISVEYTRMEGHLFWSLQQASNSFP